MAITKFNRNPLSWFPESFSTRLFADQLPVDDFFITEQTLPAMNVKEHKNDFEIELAVPGFSKNDIEVSLENDVLHICAENKDEVTEEEDNYTRREFNYNTLNRKLQLPKTVDPSKKVKANYKNGILFLHLAKKEEAKIPPKKVIEIG